MKTLIICTMLIAISLPVSAQYKYEKESRIRKSDVPPIAANFVDSIAFSSKVKWYQEIGFNTISFEAKAKYQRKNYSIEFSGDGLFEDVEIEIKASEIPPATLSNILGYLSEKYNKYSLEKIQVQYSGNRNLVKEFLQNKRTSDGLVANYEILISSKLDGAFTMLEYLFSDQGKYLQHTQIVINRTDNIEF